MERGGVLKKALVICIYAYVVYVLKGKEEDATMYHMVISVVVLAWKNK